MIKILILFSVLILSSCALNQQETQKQYDRIGINDCVGKVAVKQEITIYSDDDKTPRPKSSLPRATCMPKDNVPKSEYDKALRRQIKDHKG